MKKDGYIPSFFIVLIEESRESNPVGIDFYCIGVYNYKGNQ